jgi:hypothetical protein
MLRVVENQIAAILDQVKLFPAQWRMLNKPCSFPNPWPLRKSMSSGLYPWPSERPDLNFESRRPRHSFQTT